MVLGMGITMPYTMGIREGRVLVESSGFNGSAGT